MQLPPRDPQEPLLDRATLKRMAAQAALVAAVGLGAFELGRGWLHTSPPEAQTMTFLAMSAGQVLGPCSTSAPTGVPVSEAHPVTGGWRAALAAAAVSEAAALTMPGLRHVLGLRALPAVGWVAAGALAVVPLASVQIGRAIRQ